jgi:hypothetical protein
LKRKKEKQTRRKNEATERHNKKHTETEKKKNEKKRTEQKKCTITYNDQNKQASSPFMCTMFIHSLPSFPFSLRHCSIRLLVSQLSFEAQVYGGGNAHDETEQFKQNNTLDILALLINPRWHTTGSKPASTHFYCASRNSHVGAIHLY